MAERTSGKAATGHAAENGGTEQHGLFSPCRQQRFSSRVGEKLADEIELARPATDDDPVDRRSRCGLRFDDLAKAIADATKAGDVERDEIVEIALHAEADDDRAGMRIGEGRAVAEEFGHDMQAIRKCCHGGQRCRLFCCKLRKQNRQWKAALFCQRHGLARRRMEGQELVDCGTRRRLAALVQPQARHHGRKIRTPDARHEDRFRCRSHRAGGCTEDIAEIVFRRTIHTHRPDPASMGIDHARADRCAGGKAKLRSGAFRQAVAERRAGFNDALADARKILVRQNAEADLAEIARIPALFMGEIGPFAGHGAGRAGKIARRAPGQKIRQIEELPGGIEHLRAVFLEPQEFRRFHFRRDAPADITQDLVA